MRCGPHQGARIEGLVAGDAADPLLDSVRIDRLERVHLQGHG